MERSQGGSVVEREVHAAGNFCAKGLVVIDNSFGLRLLCDGELIGNEFEALVRPLPSMWVGKDCLGILLESDDPVSMRGDMSRGFGRKPGDLKVSDKFMRFVVIPRGGVGDCKDLVEVEIPVS